MFGSTTEIQQLAARGRVIDVRTPPEFRAFHIPGAINIPLDSLSLHVARLSALHGSLALTCHSGKRAEQARLLLASCGKHDVVMVEGGTAAWRNRGEEVTVGTATISLERQVRIAAGTMAALGAALALGVSPLFALIPLAIGTGLTVAGLTDTCLLGMLLARMPWNRGGLPDAESSVALLETACSSSR